MNERRSEAVLVAMLAALLVLGIWLLAGPPAAEAAASCQFYKGTRSSLTCEFGLELWEEGKKSERIFQSWNLDCRFPETECTLERSVFVVWPGFETTTVDIHRHSTSDGSLKVFTIDLANWRLSFDVVYQDPLERGERMPVLMQLEGGPRYLGIKSFQAKDVVRTTLVNAVVSQEWRIPEYSYTLNVPIVLSGRKNAEEKDRDDLMKKLSSTDQQAFERSFCVDFEAWLKQEPLRKFLTPHEKKLQELERQMKEAEGMNPPEGLLRASELAESRQSIIKAVYQKEEVRTLLRDKVRQCLAGAGMSKTGAELASSYVLRRFMP